jgi:hypothetical protein
MVSFNNPPPKSIVIIGAAGRTGRACLHKLATHSRIEKDLSYALEKTNADVVIVSIGNGDSVRPTDVRTASAKALARVLKQPQFNNVRVIIVSAAGAGASKIIVGFGLGSLISFHLRHVLKDHTGQEAALCSTSLHSRTTVVRATCLTDNRATGKLVEYGDTEECPSTMTDRADLADWIAKATCDRMESPEDHIVNVTSVKKQIGRTVSIL